MQGVGMKDFLTCKANPHAKIISADMDVINIFEIEFSDYDMILMYIKDQTLKDVVLDGFKALMHTAEENEYARYGLDHTARHFINNYKGLGGVSSKMNFDAVSRFFKGLQIYISKESYDSIKKSMVKDPKQVTGEEVVKIMKHFMKKPEIRPLFKKYCPEHTDKTNSDQKIMTMDQ